MLTEIPWQLLEEKNKTKQIIFGQITVSVYGLEDNSGPVLLEKIGCAIQ